MDRVLNQLGVDLTVRRRPPLPVPNGNSIDVTLVPQGNGAGPRQVSFGVPFPPGLLDDVQDVRIRTEEGEPLPRFARPLAHWWIDGVRGSVRSTLVQFEYPFDTDAPVTVRLTWNGAGPGPTRDEIPVADTLTPETVDGHLFHRPDVVAVLPPDWLCDSWLVWQQTPAPQNSSAPWFDRYLLESLPGAVSNIAADGFAPHLFDRAAAFIKAYARHGEADMLLAALRSADFYVANLDEDGFFARKPGDFKYVYTEGPALAYLLTGDPRYRAAVDRALAAWQGWGRIEYQGDGFWTERHTGFGLLAHLHAYELSGERALLEKAKRFFEGVYRMQVDPLHGGPPDGAWLRKSGHEREEEGEHWLTSPWMSAFLTDGIWKLWMLTGDARCPASLAMYARFILRHGLTEDGNLHYLASGPGLGESVASGGSAHNVEGAYLLALGWYLSGGRDDGLREAINRLWPPVLQEDANTPPRRFTWTFRETSLLVWLLQSAP